MPRDPSLHAFRLPTGFLDLAPEIREMIYDYYFSNISIYCHAHHRCEYRKPKMRSLSIMFACKAMSKEVQESMYRHTQFWVKNCMCWRDERSRKLDRAAIRHLNVELGPKRTKPEAIVLYGVLNFFTHLKRPDDYHLNDVNVDFIVNFYRSWDSMLIEALAELVGSQINQLKFKLMVRDHEVRVSIDKDRKVQLEPSQDLAQLPVRVRAVLELLHLPIEEKSTNLDFEQLHYGWSKYLQALKRDIKDYYT